MLFHRKLREELSKGRATYIHDKVMGITNDLDRLYATEEWLVEEHWSDMHRLNMLPGGKSELTYPREHRRKGLPAPWVSKRWKDNAWAVA